jgi:hypothetical protein
MTPFDRPPSVCFSSPGAIPESVPSIGSPASLRTFDYASSVDHARTLYRPEIRFGYATCNYSLINPVRVFLRLIRAAARSTTTSGAALGGR